MIDLNIMKLRRIFESYLDWDKYGETEFIPYYKMSLVDDAPEEAKKAFKEYVRIEEENERLGIE